MNLKTLDKILETEPKYRKEQVLQAIYRDSIDNWDEASNLPKNLRENLKKECSLEIVSELFISDDKRTQKVVITLPDGNKIETVLMKHKEGRNTVCVSCQVGCPVGCKFCATGKMGLTRNLTTYEILEQIIYFARLLKKESEGISNIVFMGMGEPFLNYNNVMTAIRTLNDPKLFNIGARHISVSTSGIIEGIKKFSEEKLQVNLALSLHAPTNETRSSIMPLNNQFNIQRVMRAIDEYISKTKRRVMIEYLMLDGVNDTEKDAENLSNILHHKLCFVNLISYNPTGDFEPSSGENIMKFKEILERNGIEVVQRFRFGRGIKAACGQLIIH